MTRETRRATMQAGSLLAWGLLTAAGEVISCERSPTSAADSNSTRKLGCGVPVD